MRDYCVSRFVYPRGRGLPEVVEVEERCPTRRELPRWLLQPWKNGSTMGFVTSSHRRLGSRSHVFPVPALTMAMNLFTIVHVAARS
jgi:hypothetical protein